MFKKILSLSLLSACISLGAAEQQERTEFPIYNRKDRVKIVGITLGNLNIQRDPELIKTLLVTAKEMTLEQKRTFTKIDFHHFSPVAPGSPFVFGQEKLPRTVVVGPKTIVTHQALDGTKTVFQKDESHQCDEVIQKEEKTKQRKEEKERAAAAALAQAEHRRPSQLRRGKPVGARVKKRESEEALYSLSKRSSTEALDDFKLSEQEYPTVHSGEAIKFSPSSK